MRYDRIDISKIIPNPHNPRGIQIAQEDRRLPLLKDSISKFGILVPLVVVPRKDKYLLIDGERRYVAAKQLGMTELPAYISSKGLTDRDLLYRMFHIHHNREQWGPIPQCRALEIPYRQIMARKHVASIENEDARIKAVAEELSNETGIEPRTALDRIYFLRWPAQIREKMYRNPTDDYWYICEIEEKIIIPAMRNYPEYFEAVPVDEVREDLLRKLEAHTVARATDVREVARITSTNMTKPGDRRKVLKILADLHRNKEMTYSEAREEFFRQFPELQDVRITPRRLVNELRRVASMLENFDVDSMTKYKGHSKASPEQLKTAAESAMESLRSLIEEISPKQR